MHPKDKDSRSTARRERRAKRTTIIEWRNAIRASPLDRTAKLVALMLSTYFGAHELTAWPGRKRLAADCGLSVRSVEQAVKRVEAAGLLKVVRSLGGRRSNLYAACLPEANELRPDADFAAKKLHRRGADDGGGGETRSPEGGEAAEGTRGHAAAPDGRGVPLEECVVCGLVRPLPDWLRCAECIATEEAA